MLSEQSGIQVDKFYPPTDWQYSFPEGYTRLDYLTFTNAQYIELNFKANQDTRVITEVSFSTVISDQAIFSSRDTKTTNTFSCILVGHKIRADYNTTRIQTVAPIINTYYKIDFNKNNFYINNNLEYTFNYTNFQSSYNMTIGVGLVSGATPASYLRGNLKQTIIFDNGTLAFNLVPVKRNSDNKPGMYDLVNNVFYINQGSGDDFVIGPALYTNKSQIDIRQKNNLNFGKNYEFNSNDELTWANPDICLIYSNGEKHYGDENIAVVPAGLAYNNTTTPSNGYVDMRTQVFTPAPEGSTFKRERKVQVVAPEDNTITLLYGTDPVHHLPSEYTELEYIQSDGNQYIDTGYTPTLNTKARVIFSALTYKDWVGYFGSRNDPYRFCLTTFSNGSNFTFSMSNDTWSDNKTTLELNKKYDCIAYNGKQIINGVEYNEPIVENWGDCGTFKLHKVESGTATTNRPANYYLCQIWENDILVKNLIPARRKSDSAVGMYDLVEGEFLENQGTGTFTAVELKYKLFGLLAQVSSGTYDVYIDDVFYATTASNSQTDIDFSTLGAEYVSIGTCTTPEELILHKIVIKPNTSGSTITYFQCRRTTGETGNQIQGILWYHFELNNNINLTALNYSYNAYTNKNCLVITAQNNMLFISAVNNVIAGGVSELKYTPIFDFSKRINNVNYLFLANASKLKRLIINNNDTTRSGFTELVRNNTNCEQITGKYSNYALGQRSYENNYKLKVLPTNNRVSSSNTITSSTNLSNLYPTKIDLSTANDRTQVLLNGSSTYPMRGLQGLKVSDEAPFNGTSPQIDVSYTGLGRNELVELFNSMPDVSQATDGISRAINITAASGNNLTLSGNATIDSEGILSSVDSSSSCITPSLPTEFRTMEMMFKVKRPNATSSSYVSITGFGSTTAYKSIVANDTKGHRLRYSSSIDIITISNSEFNFVTAANNGYYAKLNVVKENNNYKYKLSLSLNKITWISKEAISEYNVCSGTISLLRSVTGAGGGNPQMFLEESYIKVDNNYFMKGYLLDSDRAIVTNKGWTITG